MKTQPAIIIRNTLMYPSPYIHDDYAAALEDVIVHILQFIILDVAKFSARSTIYVDTHAGAGFYRLNRATKSRLSSLERSSKPLYLGRCHGSDLTRFVTLLKHMNNNASNIHIYPGSPMIAYSVLGRRTPMIFCERSYNVYKRLTSFAKYTRLLKVFNADGFALARKVLGVLDNSSDYILYIDPAYEVHDFEVPDYHKIRALFCVCTVVPEHVMCIVTYPASRMGDLLCVGRILSTLPKTSYRRLATAEVQYSSPRYALRGAGLFVVNGPIDFPRRARAALSELASKLNLKGARIDVRQWHGCS